MFPPDYIDNDRPDFSRQPYDYRNMEEVGHWKGVGQRGKVGHMGSSDDPNPMPPRPSDRYVPRDLD